MSKESPVETALSLEQLTEVLADALDSHFGHGDAIDDPEGQLKSLVTDVEVDPDILRGMVGELVPLVQNSLTNRGITEEDSGPSPSDLTEYAYDKHDQRMNQITTASENIPDIEELTQLDA